ncbi:MAG: ribonuclease III [Myxococcota bacterium]
MSDEQQPMAEVERRLGYTFRDPDLLRDALTHRSLANERPKLAPQDNERLEFLGDSVVALVASTLLFERFPAAREGELTRRRADLVCESGLERIARVAAIGPALRLGKGEERSGGREKPRLLASALEACFGAAYLDGGLAATMEIGRRLFADAIEGVVPGEGDYKSRVQETVQAAGGSVPQYRLVDSQGPDHDRRFYVEIMIDGSVQGRGEGRSKIEAEQAAAREALAALRVGSDR